MIIKSRVDHHVTFAFWARFQLQKVAHDLTASVVKPLASDIGACFIVGCGHSGTTLMASRLGLAANVYLIPKETGALNPENGLYTSRMVIQEWLTMTESQGKQVLLEKTPKHIHSVERIWRILPDANVLVMVRNPLDTCASLYRRFGSLEHAIERWVIDNERAAEIRGAKNVTLIKYEDLVSSPEAVLSMAAKKIGAVWSNDILSREYSPYSLLKQPGQMALREQQVTRKVNNPFIPTRSLLTEPEADHVVSRTRKVASKLGYL